MGLSKYYNPELCKNLAELRKKHKYTQKYVSEYLGTAETVYNRYERGVVELPIRKLIQLCELYGISADEMLGIKEQ